MPPMDDMPDAVARGVLAREQGSARWRTQRIVMMIVELNALAGQPVEMRRLQPGVAMAAYIAIALIVGDDEDDVWRSRHICASYW